MQVAGCNLAALAAAVADLVVQVTGHNHALVADAAVVVGLLGHAVASAVAGGTARCRFRSARVVGAACLDAAVLNCWSLPPNPLQRPAHVRHCCCPAVLLRWPLCSLGLDLRVTESRAAAALVLGG